MVQQYDKISYARKKSNACELYRNNRTSACFRSILSFFQVGLKNFIKMSKQKYYSGITNKLTMTRKSPKTFWYFLKPLLNNEKIPIIPPLFPEKKL